MRQHAPQLMRKLFVSALFFVAGSVCLPGLQAQTVYRCGNTYSQVPCPDAHAVQVDDRREPEQKQQTDAATQRDTKLAESLKKERLALEKSAPHGTQHKRKASSTAALKKEPQQDKMLTKITPKLPDSKRFKPDGFVAQIPSSAPKPVAKK